MFKAIGTWLRKMSFETVAILFGALCLLIGVFFLRTAIRFEVQGEKTEALVTEVEWIGQRGNNRTATLRYRVNGHDYYIKRQWKDVIGTTCTLGCYRKGERVQLFYLPDDPQTAGVAGGIALFGGPLMAIAFGSGLMLFGVAIKAKWVVVTEDSTER